MELPAPALRLLTAYCDATTALRWLVEHEGETLTDNPKVLKLASRALAVIDGEPVPDPNICPACKRDFPNGGTCPKGGCPMGGDV